MRTFVIGDIHGCFDELKALLEKVALKDEDLLICLGDIVDRGNNSTGVYNFVVDRPHTRVIMGNHERKHLRGILSYSQDIVKVQFGPEYPAFLAWLQTLGYYIETADAIIVHAFYEHDKAIDAQKEEVLCGATAGERYLEKKYATGSSWYDYYTGSKPIIYGHQVVGDSPRIVNNTFGIDTGACHGGFLTAVELPGFIIHQVKAKGDYWHEQQKLWQLPVLKARDWANLELASIRKQVEKLKSLEASSPVTQQIENWLIQLDTLLSQLKPGIDLFTERLLAQFPDSFNQEASAYLFKTFLFKSKAKNLTVEDIRNTLTTPEKILVLAQALGFADLPGRTPF